MPNNSSMPAATRTSLTKRLLFLIAIVIIAVNAIQVVFVTQNARKDIIEEDLDMYANMIDGYRAALENQVQGYFKELNGYINAEVMKEGDFEECRDWIQSPESKAMRGEFDYIMFAGSDGMIVSIVLCKLFSNFLHKPVL